MEAQTGPVTEELHPRWGREWGTPVFYVGEVLSFHSQSFGSVSETEGRKKNDETTNKHATYENSAGQPRHSPGGGCGCLSLDFVLSLSSLLAAAASVQPRQRLLAQGWGGSAPSRSDGCLLLAARGRSPHTSWDMWQRDGSQGPFLSSGAVPAPPHPAALSLNPPPRPGLQHPSNRSCPPAAPAFAPPTAFARNPARPAHLGLPVPPPTPCHPAPCHRHQTRPLSLCVPPLPWGCSAPWDRAHCLGLLGAAATKMPPSRPSPLLLASLLSSVPSLSPTRSLAMHRTPCFFLHSLLPRLLPVGCRRAGRSGCEEQLKPEQSTQKKGKKGGGKRKKYGKCTYAKQICPHCSLLVTPWQATTVGGYV